MNKVLKPANKQKRIVKKPPKEVTLMIQSKMLEQSHTRQDMRISTKRHSKGVISQTSLDRLLPKTISLRDMNMSQRISSKNLRPSTSRDTYSKNPAHFSNKKHEQEEFPFRPQINQKSRSISRNREINHPKSCRHHKCAQQHESQQHPSQMNPISHFKCFEKLLYRVTSYFENQRLCWQFKQLTYANILVLLHRIGYVQYPTEQELIHNNHSDSLKKAYQLWLYLTDDLTASLDNFFIMVCAIEKIHIQTLDIIKAVGMFINYLCRRSTNFRMDPSEQPEYRFIVSRPERTISQDGELILERTALARIPQEFKLFIINRLNSHLERDPLTDRQSHNHTRQNDQQPQSLLSEKSNKLAERKRRKMVEIIKTRRPCVESVTLNDILNFKADNMRVCHERQQTMTTNTTHISCIQPIRRQLRISVSQLCFLAKPKMVIERDRENLQFEKVEHICTFQPEIHNMPRQHNEESIDRIRNASKSIERMKEGRLFRKEKKRLIETGWTNSSRKPFIYMALSHHRNKENKTDRKRISSQQSGPIKNEATDTMRLQMQDSIPSLTTDLTCESSFKLPSEQTQVQITNCSSYKGQTLPTLRCEEKQLRIPLLFIDINIDQTKKERIVIYDEDSSEKLAEEFARRHNLDTQMQAKLRELLEYQMSSILTKIEQQAEEQDNI